MGKNNSKPDKSSSRIKEKFYCRQCDVFYSEYETKHRKQIIIIPTMILETYIFVKNLGSGGFGTVFKVKSIKDNRHYALKIMLLDDLNKDEERSLSIEYEKFREIKILKELDNSNIVKYKIHYEFQEEGLLMILISLAEDNLETFLKNIQPNRQKLLTYFGEICNGLNYLHSKNIIHKDLKPKNILIKNDTIKICDFGISRKRTDEKTFTKQSDNICGTLGYISPEILNGSKFNEKVDIWALGIIFHQMLTKNIHPIKIMNDYEKEIVGNSYEIEIDESIDDPIIRQIILGCLKRNPNDRYSAEEIIELLNEIDPNIFDNNIKYFNFTNKKKIDLLIRGASKNVLCFSDDVFSTPEYLLDMIEEIKPLYSLEILTKNSDNSIFKNQENKYSNYYNCLKKIYFEYPINEVYLEISPTINSLKPDNPWTNYIFNVFLDLFEEENYLKPGILKIIHKNSGDWYKNGLNTQGIKELINLLLNPLINNNELYKINIKIMSWNFMNNKIMIELSDIWDQLNEINFSQLKELKIMIEGKETGILETKSFVEKLDTCLLNNISLENFTFFLFSNDNYHDDCLIPLSNIIGRQKNLKKLELFISRISKNANFKYLEESLSIFILEKLDTLSIGFSSTFSEIEYSINENNLEDLFLKIGSGISKNMKNMSFYIDSANLKQKYLNIIKDYLIKDIVFMKFNLYYIGSSDVDKSKIKKEIKDIAQINNPGIIIKELFIQ